MDLNEGQKLLVYKFENGHSLSTDEIKHLYDLDDKCFKETGEHIVSDFSKLEKTYFDELIKSKQEVKDKVEGTKANISRGIASIFDGSIFMFKNIKLIIVGVAIVALSIILLINYINKNKELKDAYDRGVRDGSGIVEVLDSDRVKVTKEAILTAIVPAQELTTYTYNYANIGRYSKSAFKNKEGKAVNVPFTVDETLYAYSGTIGAGVRDLNEIEVLIDDENKNITLTLPKPELLHHDLSKFDYENTKSSIFVSSDLKDYEDFKLSLKKEVENEVTLDEEFWTKVREQAESTLTSLLTLSGTLEEYEIKFVWNE